MKNKVLSWITAGLSLLTIFPLFLGIYVPYITVGDKTTTGDALTLFDSYKGIESTFAHTIVMILVFVVLALAVAYIALTLVDTFKGKGKGFDNIRRILSIIQIVVGVLILILGLVFIIANTSTNDAIKTTTGLNCGIGLVFAILVPVICGILGLLATKKRK